MAPKVWLVTGATSGLGRALVSKIREVGDKVIATGRQAEQRLAELNSDDVAVLDLDVSASREEWSCRSRRLGTHLDTSMSW
jgi:NAD(P)-dependent dehydrogenase (short-subunit alcohol dehydrogenase family)